MKRALVQRAGWGEGAAHLRDTGVTAKRQRGAYLGCVVCVCLARWLGASEGPFEGAAQLPSAHACIAGQGRGDPSFTAGIGEGDDSLSLDLSPPPCDALSCCRASCAKS